MTPEFFLCDICNSKCDKDFRICVVYDRSMDAAGSMDDDAKYIDICGLCAILAIKYMFLRLDGTTRADLNQGKRFLNYVQTQSKKHAKTLSG